jgi:hypothetical protein
MKEMFVRVQIMYNCLFQDYSKYLGNEISDGEQSPVGSKMTFP